MRDDEVHQGATAAIVRTPPGANSRLDPTECSLQHGA